MMLGALPPAIGQGAKIVDIVDLVVDAKSLAGQRITIRKCDIIGGGSFMMACGRGAAVVNIDHETLEPEALRRSMKWCHRALPPDDIPECVAAGVTGTVAVYGGSVSLTHAEIAWARPASASK